MRKPYGVEIDYTPTVKTALHTPALEEVAQVLQSALQANFATAHVAAVDCPDLSQAPFSLAAPGICGSTAIVDIGGVPYLTPTPKLNHVYNLRHVAEEIGNPKAVFIGAGAGSWRLTGVNCELMPNTNIGTGDIRTTYAKIQADGTGLLTHYESNEFSILLNVLASNGERGRVLKVEAATRTGPKNFVTCMREALKAHFGEQPVGLGGAFVIENASAKIHVMPDFAAQPLQTEEEVQQWLRFFTYTSPLTCLSVFVSHDPGLGLRVEHTHCFSAHGQGGHYHHDTTPAEVSYTGYFVVAENLFRVDRPM